MDRGDVEAAILQRRHHRVHCVERPGDQQRAIEDEQRNRAPLTQRARRSARPGRSTPFDRVRRRRPARDRPASRHRARSAAPRIAGSSPHWRHRPGADSRAAGCRSRPAVWMRLSGGSSSRPSAIAAATMPRSRAPRRSRRSHRANRPCRPEQHDADELRVHHDLLDIKVDRIKDVSAATGWRGGCSARHRR